MPPPHPPSHPHPHPHPHQHQHPPPYLHQPTVTTSEQQQMEAPIRVTRPPNAFLLFNKEMRKQLKDSNPSMKVAEISKEIGERWKNLSPEEKSRYVSQANSIKETQRALHPNSMYIRRSKAELAKADTLHTNHPHHKQRKRHRRDKNPAAPKHPLSAYMWFLTEVRPETMQTYPGSTVGQISKLCADRWNTMTETERLPWHTKAQADKERYAREMQIYASQHDHPMGRGTRQKYRAAAAAAAA
ncbi:high mobility group box domain-containing protein, partial [Phascolomyces articulosus]